MLVGWLAAVMDLHWAVLMAVWKAGRSVEMKALHWAVWMAALLVVWKAAKLGFGWVAVKEICWAAAMVGLTVY
jgi:hypothetical protein